MRMEQKKTTLRHFMLLSLFITALTLNAVAQSTIKEREWFLNGNLNMFLVFNNYEIDVISTNGQSYRYKNEEGSVNIGLSIKRKTKNGWFQEYGITTISYKVYDEIGIENPSNVNEPTIGDIRKLLNVYLRWEYGRQFKITNSNRLTPEFSISLDPFFQKENFTPKTSRGYPHRYYKIGCETHFIPRLEYRFSEKVYCVLKLPIRFNSLSFLHEHLDHPLIKDDERNKNSVINEFDIKLNQVSLGVSYKI